MQCLVTIPPTALSGPFLTPTEPLLLPSWPLLLSRLSQNFWLFDVGLRQIIFFFLKKDFQVPVSWICRHGYRGWLDLPCVRYHDQLCRGRVSWTHCYSHSSRVGGWKPTVSVDVFTGRHSEWIRSGTHSALISKSSTPAPLRGNL